MRKILVMVDLIIFCLFAASFYGIILHFPSVSRHRVLLVIKLSARLYWRTPVAGSVVHLSSVNDGNTSLC